MQNNKYITTTKMINTLFSCVRKNKKRIRLLIKIGIQVRWKKCTILILYSKIQTIWYICTLKLKPIYKLQYTEWIDCLCSCMRCYPSFQNSNVPFKRECSTELSHMCHLQFTKKKTCLAACVKLYLQFSLHAWKSLR